GLAARHPLLRRGRRQKDRRRRSRGDDRDHEDHDLRKAVHAAASRCKACASRYNRGRLTFISLVQQTDPSPAPKPAMRVYCILILVAALFVAVVLPRLRRRRDGPQDVLGTFGSAAGGAREELERLLTEIQDLSRE